MQRERSREKLHKVKKLECIKFKNQGKSGQKGSKIVKNYLDNEKNSWFQVFKLPSELVLTKSELVDLWNLHPKEYHTIKMFGKEIKTPRWQQAYGKSYKYSGNVNEARPMPALVKKMQKYFSKQYKCDFNMALINWYKDGSHYIGFHSDDTRQIVPNTPILALSLLQSRRFAIQHKKTKHKETYTVSHNDVMVMGGDFQTTHSIQYQRRESQLAREQVLLFVHLLSDVFSQFQNKFKFLGGEMQQKATPEQIKQAFFDLIQQIKFKNSRTMIGQLTTYCQLNPNYVVPFKNIITQQLSIEFECIDECLREEECDSIAGYFVDEAELLEYCLAKRKLSNSFQYFKKVVQQGSEVAYLHPVHELRQNQLHQPNMLRGVQNSSEKKDLEFNDSIFGILYEMQQKVQKSQELEIAPCLQLKGDAINSLVGELYKDQGLQCCVCGHRTNSAAKLVKHLDHHFKTKKELEERKEQRVFRNQFKNTNQWIKRRKNEDEDEEEKQEDEQFENYVKSKEKNHKCDICGEKFNLIWCKKTEEWLLDMAIKVEFEQKNSMEGGVVHHECFKFMEDQELRQ